MELIFQPVRINTETVLLKNEIAALKDSKDPALKQQIKEKQDKLNALENFNKVYIKHDLYNNRSNAEELFNAYKEKTGIEELSDEEKEYILNTAYGEKTSENNYIINAELELAYKDYLKTVNGIDKDYIFDTDIDKSFTALLHYYELSKESKKLVTYINLLHNPESYIQQVEKAQTWMSRMYNNRKEYYTDIVNKHISGVENNELLNRLADMNIFIDLDAFQAYMEDDILPEEFIDETTKQIIPKGTERYNEIFSILALNKRLKAEDVEKPSLDESVQTQVDDLNTAEQNEIDALPKIESIKIIKKVTAKDKPFTIKDIISELNEFQYVDAIYEGTDQKITMYEAFDGVKMDNKDGAIVDIDNTKDKFSEYTIYKKTLQPDPELVKDINKKYDDLRDDVAEKNAEKKTKTKADIYSNYTPVEELPADLKKQLQEAFSQTETAMNADENEASDEEFLDLFKTFVRNNSLAEEIINNYNTKSKEAVDKEKLGEIDDFDFVLNNKNLNTASYSIDDIKVLKKQFEKLRDDSDSTLKKTAYQDIINKFDRLISTREVKSFTPEVQEIIKTIKNKLIASQNKVKKIGDEGYQVGDKLLERVTNFIQQFKTDKYKYSGTSEIEEAFNYTIGAAGLSESVIKSFIKQLNDKLHVDSVKKDYGYTDDTEDIVKKHLTEILDKGLNKTLYKKKEDLLESIQGLISENAYEASRTAGNYIDKQLRALFTKDKAPLFDEKKITKEAYDKLFGPTSFLKEIKQKIDSGELYAIADGLIVYDIDANVAGEMDLLLIDKQGKLQIIDFKTGKESKWDGFVDKTNPGLNKTEDYTLQQYTYARLLKKMTGLDADINIFPIETVLDQNNKLITEADEPTNKKLTGVGKWYFPLDPNFSDAQSKINAAISLEAPGIKVATSINPVYKKQLKTIGYPNELINSFTKEEAAKYSKIPYSEYVKLNSVSSLSFGETSLDVETEVITETVTKPSQLNLKEGDTVIVNVPIMEENKIFAPQGATLTVLKSDEKSVSFTYGNEKITLTLPEMDKHVTTMGIEEVKQAEKTQEVLDAIDKQTVTETINALTDFIGDKKAIENAINKASSNDVTAEELTNDLLEDLSCK
jgi:hypothetical protein